MMRLGVTILFCVLFGLVAEGHPQSAKIVGDTLVWWPRDYKGVADFSIPSDIAITVEFHKEKLTRITLSDGLKNVIRRRLDRQNEKVDYSVLKWIE